MQLWSAHTCLSFWPYLYGVNSQLVDVMSSGSNCLNCLNCLMCFFTGFFVGVGSLLAVMLICFKLDDDTIIAGFGVLFYGNICRSL